MTVQRAQPRSLPKKFALVVAEEVCNCKHPCIASIQEGGAWPDKGGMAASKRKTNERESSRTHLRIISSKLHAHGATCDDVCLCYK